MQTCNSGVIHKRSNIIPIKKKISTTTNMNYTKSEYSLKQIFFDPSKSSPPNDFMNKLQKRIKLFNNTFYVDNMDDSLDNE